MALFTISDLHLSLKTNKSMEVFGGVWKDYIDKLKVNWNSMVEDGDLVVIPGDISWATYLSDSLDDFKFLDSLKGEKIILKGNHDYWFETINKQNIFFKENGIETIKMLHNSFYTYENTALCGTKGFDISKKPTTESNKKLLQRETLRLTNSILKAREDGFNEIFVFVHYPPLLKDGKFNDNPIMEVLTENKIKKCFYGHLHTRSHKSAVNGNISGIEFKLISGDYLDFKPFKII